MLLQTVKQATKTLYNGLTWDAMCGLIVHATDSDGKTVCGKKIRDASYGWYRGDQAEEVNCPDCRSKISP